MHFVKLYLPVLEALLVHSPESMCLDIRWLHLWADLCPLQNYFVFNKIVLPSFACVLAHKHIICQEKQATCPPHPSQHPLSLSPKVSGLLMSLSVTWSPQLFTYWPCSHPHLPLLPWQPDSINDQFSLWRSSDHRCFAWWISATTVSHSMTCCNVNVGCSF